MSTIIVEDNEPDDSGAEIAAAEANAHIAEIAEEGAEEAAEEATEAAEVSEDAAELAVDAAGTSVNAALDAADSAIEARTTADDLRTALSEFRSGLITDIAQLMKAREEVAESDAGSDGVSLEVGIVSEPEIEPDSAPAETHPYYKPWGRRNK